MKKVDIYGLPHCSTCQKAIAYLEAKGVEVGKFYDLKADPLDKNDVERLVKLAGRADALFSRRAIKYRTMNLKDRDLSDSDMVKLMTDEYTFIKRPVLVDGSKALAGFSAKKYEELLSE